MTRARPGFLSLLLACAACGASGEEETSSEGEQASAIRVGRAFTYTSVPTSAGEFLKLVLRTDGTYRAERLVVCVAAPCYPIEENGTYSFYRRAGAAVMVLKDRQGNVVDTYQVAFGAGLIFLRRSAQDTWHRMVLAAATPY